MELIEAIKARHSVRKYLDRPIEKAKAAQLRAEIDRVTTPGGITIRGLNAMEEAGFTAAVVAGLTKG